MSRFDDCLEVVLENEGGYSDHRDDRGGATNFGVTQNVYDLYREDHGLPLRSVRLIEPREVKAIYKGYWRDADCACLPEPLDLLVFDAAVNHGAGRAVKLLQKVLGVEEDGVVGRETLTALHEDVVALGVSGVCEMYLNERRRLYKRIVEKNKSQGVFLEGWLARVDRLEELVA